MITYSKAIPHWGSALLYAEENKLNPIRAIVGAIVTGPVNLRKNPIAPVAPKKSCKIDAVAIAP